MTTTVTSPRRPVAATRAQRAALAAPLLLVLVAACVRRPVPEGRRWVESLVVEGNHQVDEEDIEEQIATAERSALFGGALENVPLLSVAYHLTLEYELLDRFVLERDLSRIERFYRRRGFYDARVRATRIFELPGERARVEIAVDEGQPIRIARVDLSWKDWGVHAGDVTRRVHLARRTLERAPRMDEDSYDKALAAMRRAMADEGFAYGEAKGTVRIDLVRRLAVISVELELGPVCVYGPVTLRGLARVPEGPVRTALDLHPGQRYSLSDLESAEHALADFGVFSSVEVVPRPSRGDGPRKTAIPVDVIVQESTLGAVKLGGGVEVGSGRADVHAGAAWEHRNFLGGLRRLSIENRPGLVVSPSPLDRLQLPERFFPENRLRIEFRQPGAFEPRTNALVRGSFNIYRLASDEGPTVEAQPNVVGYREGVLSVGLDRSFLQGRLYGAVSANAQLDEPFSYTLDRPPPGYQRVFIPFFDLATALDLRKNRQGKPERMRPARGLYASNDVQVATLGDARDVRVRPELRGYRALSRRAVLAARLTTGFLFPFNYGDTLTEQAPVLTEEDCLARLAAGEGLLQARDRQLLSFRAFFSGGASSNRGYGYNGVGPHEFVAYLSQRTSCRDLRKVATGGLTLWEASLEVRQDLVERLGVVLFADASDLTRERVQLRLGYPHLSLGLGVRYDTPVGPLRLDLGWRVPGAQKLDDALPPEEGEPSRVLGLPIAVSIAIGEAF